MKNNTQQVKDSTKQACNAVTKAQAKVRELENTRDALRRSGEFHGEVDARLAAARTDACGALLHASKACRDDGLTGWAYEYAARYAQEEHLANSMRENAERATRRDLGA